MPTEEKRPMDSGDGKPSNKKLSEDGRGGTKPTPGKKPGARYLYYRLYTKDGPLESNSLIYSNDHFISRIVSSSVRPPHTAASLMRYLCKIEGLALQNCILFQSLSEMTALDDSIRLSLHGTTGPERRSQVTSAAQPRELSERDYEQRYVYYRVYDDDGEIIPKTSFDEKNPPLGRVNTLSLPPPHAVSSLKNRIIISEDLSGHDVQLFEDEASDSAMNDSDALTLLSDTFPGFTEDQPIAITYESGTKNGSADYEDPNEIQIRELTEELAQIKKEFEEGNLTHRRELEEANRTHARELAEVREESERAKETHEREIYEARFALLKAQSKLPSTFTKKLKATRDCIDGQKDATFHSTKTGEMFYTDGIFRMEKWCSSDYGIKLNCYRATNSSGKLAFVDADYVIFC